MRTRLRGGRIITDAIVARMSGAWIAIERRFMRDNFGRVLTFLVRALIGNGTTRAILKTPFVRKLLAHRLTTASFQTLMRLVAPDYITFVDTIKKMP